MNSEDRIIELIAKFNETGEINISDFKEAAFYDYPPETVLSSSPVGINEWGVIEDVSLTGAEGGGYDSIQYYTITTSRKIQYRRKRLASDSDYVIDFEY